MPQWVCCCMWYDIMHAWSTSCSFMRKGRECGRKDAYMWWEWREEGERIKGKSEREREREMKRGRELGWKEEKRQVNADK